VAEPPLAVGQAPVPEPSERQAQPQAAVLLEAVEAQAERPVPSPAEAARTVEQASAEALEALPSELPASGPVSPSSTQD
jgi:hypothetical protein